MSLDKFRGCILGGAIGDALGVPLEKMTSAQVLHMIGDVKQYVTKRQSYIPFDINPNPFSDAQFLKPGWFSDDTQLTLAVLDAIIQSDGVLDMDLQAQVLMRAYQECHLCWGGSIKHAARNLLQKVHWSESGSSHGGGSGVLMRGAPLGLLQSSPRRDLEFDIFMEKFGRMTHGLSSAIVAGYVHAQTIGLLSRCTEFCPPSILMPYMRLEAWKFGRYFELEEYSISRQLALINQWYRSGCLSNMTPQEIASYFGDATPHAFSGYNCFGIAYAMFFRNPTSFDCVFDAIQAGGDTDTNASIVGSLIGALHGAKSIPVYLLEQLDDREMIEEKINAFHKVCYS